MPPEVARAISRLTGCVAILAALLLLAVPCGARAAVSCTATGPSLTFGTLNPFATAPSVTSGTASFACLNSGSVPATVSFCIAISAGSGGVSGSTLVSGASQLPLQITGGPGYPSPIGDGTAYPMAGPFVLSVGALATAAATYPLTATIPVPSSSPAPGTYTSSFTGTSARDLYTTSSTPATCSGLASGAYQIAQAPFSVTAIISTQCTVSTTPLTFPTASTLTRAVTTTATISVTCNSVVPVTVALDNGAAGSSPTTRQMRSGASAITYGIYRDAAALLPWGSTLGSDVVPLSAGTGTMTVYGRIAPQASPPPGTYADVVDVTISY